MLIFIDREVDGTYDELQQGRLILEKIPGRYICDSKKIRMTISVRLFRSSWLIVVIDGKI